MVRFDDLHGHGRLVHQQHWSSRLRISSHRIATKPVRHGRHHRCPGPGVSSRLRSFLSPQSASVGLRLLALPPVFWFLDFFSGINQPKAPSTKLRAPEKLQAPNSKMRALRVWSSKVGASLVFGAWILELFPAPYSTAFVEEPVSSFFLPIPAWFPFLNARNAGMGEPTVKYGARRSGRHASGARIRN